MAHPVEIAEPPLAEDLLTGAAAIARFVFGDESERRRVYWLADTGQAAGVPDRINPLRP